MHHDRGRLEDRYAVVHQQRHLSVRIERAVAPLVLIACLQIDLHLLVRDPELLEGPADGDRGRHRRVIEDEAHDGSPFRAAASVRRERDVWGPYGDPMTGYCQVWSTTAQTQHANLPLLQLASVGGEGLVPLVGVAVNVAIALVVDRAPFEGGMTFYRRISRVPSSRRRRRGRRGARMVAQAARRALPEDGTLGARARIRRPRSVLMDRLASRAQPALVRLSPAGHFIYSPPVSTPLGDAFRAVSQALPSRPALELRSRSRLAVVRPSSAARMGSELAQATSIGQSRPPLTPARGVRGWCSSLPSEESVACLS